jgi:hypothetical protein
MSLTVFERCCRCVVSHTKTPVSCSLSVSVLVVVAAVSNCLISTTKAAILDRTYACTVAIEHDMTRLYDMLVGLTMQIVFDDTRIVQLLRHLKCRMQRFPSQKACMKVRAYMMCIDDQQQCTLSTVAQYIPLHYHY